ncbi:bifunctional DNA primase/polymerase [Corynebacterium striatum]|uniref:bifunctional DNA primase/polymerase n=1 Tax=Corynebacterium striatum TaxID=43770 RepID=UPI001A1B13CC|nr:DNA primase [Corynebacterium striatum]
MPEYNTAPTRDISKADEWAPVSVQHLEALKLALWGLEVGPLNGKVPIIAKRQGHQQGGFYDFTDDPEKIDQWWNQWPQANIGARPPHFVVVLDVDVRSGGLETWEKLNAGHKLPATIVTATGSGGFHYWFRRPHNGPLKGHAGQGIDIKHWGGYLVMPGSVHPETAKEYTCRSWVDPLELPILPEHLMRHVLKAPTKPKPIIPVNFRGDGAGLVRTVAEAPEGQRNARLYWAACRAADNGLSIFDELANAARNIGLNESEINATINSARNNNTKGAA